MRETFSFRGPTGLTNYLRVYRCLYSLDFHVLLLDRASFVSSSFPLRIHLFSPVGLLLLLQIFLYLKFDIPVRIKVVTPTYLHVLPFEQPILRSLALLALCNLTSFHVRQEYWLYLIATLHIDQAKLEAFLNDCDTHHVLFLLFQLQIKP